MTVWIGLITLVGGLALWLSSRRERSAVPEWFPRLAAGIVFLGIATLLLTRTGILWSVLSALFSFVSIILLASIIWRLLRRR